MQRVLQKQRTLSARRRASTMLLSLAAMTCLPGCASKYVAVEKPIPQELAKPELPAWREWSTSYQDWLRSATQAGTDAPSEKMP